jgi:hypothetical protein
VRNLLGIPLSLSPCHSRHPACASSEALVPTCSGDDFAIFRVVDVNQAPLSSFFAVDLRFDAMGRHGRSVFAQQRTLG